MMRTMINDGIPSIRLRLAAAWNVLRGRPTVYRWTTSDEALFSARSNEGIYVAECNIDFGHLSSASKAIA